MRFSSTFSVQTGFCLSELIHRVRILAAQVTVVALLAAFFPPGAQAESWDDMFKGMARDMIEEGTRAIREGSDRSDQNRRQQPYEQQPHQPYQQPQQQYEYQQPAPQPTQRSSQYSRAQIQDIQTRLQMLGYNPGPADGLFGNKTAKAIAQFEIDQGLPVTGRLDRTLITALRSAIGQSNRSYQAGAGARAGLSIGQSVSARSIPSDTQTAVQQSRKQNIDKTQNSSNDSEMVTSRGTTFSQKIDQLNGLSFHLPKNMRRIASGDLRGYEKQEQQYYLVGVSQSFDNYCPSLVDPGITGIASNRIYKNSESGVNNSLEDFTEASRSNDIGGIIKSATQGFAVPTINNQYGRLDSEVIIKAFGCDDPLVKVFYKNLHKVLMNPKSSAWSVIPLYKEKVYGVSWATLGLIYYVPKHLRTKVEKQVYATRDAGQKIIYCDYGPTDPDKREGFAALKFWYQKAPENITAMIKSTPSETHPMYYLGRLSVDSCPDDLDEAMKIRRSTIVK